MGVWVEVVRKVWNEVRCGEGSETGTEVRSDVEIELKVGSEVLMFRKNLGMKFGMKLGLTLRMKLGLILGMKGVR